MIKNSATLSPISGKPASFLFESVVLGRHVARYFVDESIQYIFVDHPYWLEEAYSDPMASTDTGVLSRNLRNVSFCTTFFGLIGLNGDGFKGIDLGAGYGLFVRGMRDRGLDFYWDDPYAQNLFARGFEATERAYDIAVAFEVLEHLLNPLEYLKERKEKYRFRYLIFSGTCFIPRQIPPLDWWYWAFETGQHISFFSRNAFDYIASQLAMRVIHLGSDLYMMVDLDINVSQLRFKMAALAASRHISAFVDRKSLTYADHVSERNRLRQKEF